jgi:DNA-binding NtrC family response regulator
MIVTSALPCDSPAVRKRSIGSSFYPKFLRHPATGRAIGPRSFEVAILHVALRTLSPLSKEPSVDAAADVQLFANRFAVTPAGPAIDLSTGEPVSLTIAAAGAPSEQTRWAVRCDALRKLHHRAIARLIDFGAAGDGQRFEAWACGAPLPAPLPASDLMCEEAANFLHACSLSSGRLGPDAARSSARGPILLLPPDAGYEDAGEGPSVKPVAPLDIGACGHIDLDRRAVASIAELFDATPECRPRVVSLWGPPGAGKTTAIGELARAARLNGLVPVSTALLSAPLAATLQGRTLFVVDDDSRGDGWRALVDWAMRGPRPHVVLIAGVEEVRSVHGVALDKVAVDRLIDSVRPVELPPALALRVRRAAERADGRPGRFTSLLWRSPRRRAHAPMARPPESPRPASEWSAALRAAEQSAHYGVEGDPESCGSAPGSLVTDPSASLDWPAPGELTGLRRRIDAAIRQLAGGRHAPGDRLLRQAIGGLARRSDWSHAGRGSVALARSLLRRGRARDAQAALDVARDYCGRAHQERLLLDVATLAGHAWIDLARLDEAESVLGAAVAAAAASGEPVQMAEASLAMARCLFWRGRYADAGVALWEPPHLLLPDRTRTKILIARSRIAVGLRDLGRAVSCSADALQRAHAARDGEGVAAAACAAAFAHLAVSDLDAVGRDVAVCVAAARAARFPLLAIRARLIFAESERRRDRRWVATALLRRIERINAGSLPPIVRARSELLADVLAPGASVGRIVTRHTGITGLAALTLLTPDGSGSRDADIPAGHPGSPGCLDPVVDDIVGILHICQHAEDETAVLREVCVRLRDQLHAAGVAFIAAGQTVSPVIALDGGRIGPAVAERAMAAGIVITPHRTEDTIEAAAPVRYGGATIAAIAVRWTIGATHNLSRVPAVLAMASTAAAPAVAGAMSRRSAAASGGPTELLGISTATSELRRAVERAAAAPFCVLIEGESGSGKELVARAVHRCGPRRERPFCTLNCAALPDDLVESELFGHARGAFTGAISERPGVFEEAHGGTLFLDEIAELSQRAQAKVLRVIQEGELRRVGENVPRRVDVRIVSATNRDLRQEVGQGRFRLDLLYRLDVIRIVVSPLRDRREDIPVLADHFWRDAAHRVGSRATLAAATLAALARHDWPGNVRELQNVLAALAVRTPKRGVVPPAALPLQFADHRSCDAWRLEEARRTFDERFVRAALVRNGGHRGQAAAELGLTRQGLTKLLARLGITATSFSTAVPGHPETRGHQPAPDTNATNATNATSATSATNATAGRRNSR